MALGFFVFERATTPFDNIQNSISERFSTHETLDNRQQYQHVGAGEESKTLAGTLYPQFTGGELSLYALEKMMKAGEDYILINGSGMVLGRYIIKNISNTHSSFNSAGKARKIEFTLALTRTDNNKTTLDQLTSAFNQVPDIF